MCVGGYGVGRYGGGYGVLGGCAQKHMYYDEFVPFIFSVSGRQTFYYSFSINTKQLESFLSRGYSEKTVGLGLSPGIFLPESPPCISM